ncbi:uncharacterized protein SPSK_10356 [Sporothrix schenckii 1099-18]|uniref:Uncharacterized protein n=1 Tax=Sporothrix schenckii 1099-18 TaxID=1397361 RepID=A0A0F2LWI1_SPOSC|nr:uncharacterized protein SPSK_10356 [Sporothrix schenckii 1099-18]KJR81813.1 hypothetical protein SPSK_10356 [Sporothrix schenckii 1099-18]
MYLQNTIQDNVENATRTRTGNIQASNTNPGAAQRPGVSCMRWGGAKWSTRPEWGELAGEPHNTTPAPQTKRGCLHQESGLAVDDR